ncbi:MAG: RNA ligase, partial [Crenarchaeota archaeon]|nr:RNA ligase [Thermoproteota archaeon]
MNKDNVAEKLSEILDIPYEKIEKKLGRTIRIMSYKDINYAILREDLGSYCEGTMVLLDEEKIIHGYPSIQRLALLEGVPLHMIDEVIVEEKMDGYNVRVTIAGGRVIAITRGGYICPYTTARINRLYGDKIKEALRESEDLVLAGEVVGTENPYVVYEYPEAGGFDYFIFDALKNGRLLPLRIRDEVV